MNRSNYRGSLTSRVEADGCLESRIPTLGLHMDNVDGLSKEDCLSGPVDSGISSMGLGAICDSGFETSMESDITQKINQMSLKSEAEEPFTTLGDSMYQSVDEGFISSEVPSGEFPVPSEAKPSLPSPSEEQLQRHHQLLSLFTPDEEGDTQLHIAIIQGSSVSFALVNVAAEISPEVLNIQNLLGQSPLHLAVLTKQEVLLRHLVLRGAALDVRDRHGNTALHLACRDGNLGCMYALLNTLSVEEYREANVSCFTNFPQDLNIKNYDGETCLHMAVFHGHTDCILYLVHYAKADIDLRDGRSGRTVLHYAVEAGNMDMVRFLIERCQADVNAQTFDGATPLRLAVGRRHSNIKTLLLQAGAEASSLNSDLLDYESEDEEMDDVHIGGRLVRGLVA